MTEQMTREEMLHRLANGEDPVDISIDKWIRMRAWIKETYNTPHDPYKIMKNCHIYCDTCALCEIYKDPFMDKVYCDKCILCIAGYKCDYTNSPWKYFANIIVDYEDYDDEDYDDWLENVLNAADNMIAALIKCKGVR